MGVVKHFGLDVMDLSFGPHSTYRALDTIIRNHFVDFVASVVLPGSEEIVQTDFPESLEIMTR